MASKFMHQVTEALLHFRSRKNLGHMVSTKYLATRYLEDIRDDPDWNASTMQKRVSRECGANVHISKCY